MRRRRRMLAVMLLLWLPNSAARSCSAQQLPQHPDLLLGTHRRALGGRAQGGGVTPKPFQREDGGRSLFRARGKHAAMSLKCLHGNKVPARSWVKSWLPCEGRTPASARPGFYFWGCSAFLLGRGKNSKAEEGGNFQSSSSDASLNFFLLKGRSILFL